MPHKTTFPVSVTEFQDESLVAKLDILNTPTYTPKYTLNLKTYSPQELYLSLIERIIYHSDLDGDMYKLFSSYIEFDLSIDFSFFLNELEKTDEAALDLQFYEAENLSATAYLPEVDTNNLKKTIALYAHTVYNESLKRGIPASKLSLLIGLISTNQETYNQCLLTMQK